MKMDKRSLILSVLILVIMLAYPHYLRLISPKPTQSGAPPESSDLASEPTSAETAPSEPAAPAAPFTPPQDERRAVLETELLRIELTSTGAGIARAEVKDGGSSADTVLIEQQGFERATGALSGVKGLPDLAGASFGVEEDKAAGRVRFVYEDPARFRVVRTYEAHPDHRYMLVLEQELTHLGPQPETYQVDLAWRLATQDPKGYDRGVVTSRYLTAEGMKEAKWDRLLKRDETIAAKIQWLCLERKYFTLLVAPEQETFDSVLAQGTESGVAARARSAEQTLASGQSWKSRLLLYLGPTRYRDLKAPGLDFQEILFQGRLGWLRYFLLAGLDFFNGVFGNWGVAIILLTLATKVLFAPLTHMSFDSMRKMQALQPKVKAIQEHFKGDSQRMNKEVMELYRKNKVNPMGGCLPMLIQMPIFIALYQVLAQSVELRHAPFFGWIHDLSAPDRLFRLPWVLPLLGDGFNVLPILMLVSMVVQQKMTPGSSGSSPEQKQMMTFMPIIFGFAFYNLPSGLVLYWTLSNVLTIVHQGMMKGKEKLHLGGSQPAEA